MDQSATTDLLQCPSNWLTDWGWAGEQACCRRRSFAVWRLMVCASQFPTRCSLSLSLSPSPSLPPSLRLSISESLCVSDCVQVDDRLASLMQCCWLEEPADRPSFDEIKERLRPLLQQAELAEREGRHGPTAQRSGVSDAST